MRIAKTITAAAALALAGGSIAAQAETVRGTAPVDGESELGGLTFTTQLIVVALVAGVIAGVYAIADDDDEDPVSP